MRRMIIGIIAMAAALTIAGSAPASARGLPTSSVQPAGATHTNERTNAGLDTNAPAIVLTSSYCTDRTGGDIFVPSGSESAGLVCPLVVASPLAAAPVGDTLTAYIPPASIDVTNPASEDTTPRTDTVSPANEPQQSSPAAGNDGN